MNTATDSADFQTPRRPTLPSLLALPFSLIPSSVHSTVLMTALNRLLATYIREGEFEFLRDRVLAIQVRDAKITYQIRYAGPAGFIACQSSEKPDLSISGTIYDFMALATRREDSDTLFFNRRVVMEGDTALGLELKNWLDGMDFEAMGRPLTVLLNTTNHLIGAYERFRR
ncbi:MAG: SCP2 sterol-binding domain-containing protein [Candidatus Competibacter denitrificans]|jgi:predicted lipid carrier protein YhbT|uniref:Ubiquinone biosynthesis accessory factor UbiT n=1 Tax=Candidatus Competibacter denitrificans Run_A_D11 TaxID=1400863 RepID=W6MDZ2_9GAMM|nr:SCP2 sterol-binding domain-containing protein [Candidatus Competibacter denitrificans]CDI03708.1 putative Sterol-binding domain protein [Candidatus Competibacter denitrificans Run_A_D11]HAS87142.1 sterol-binding protein [Candidatus Competibacteraceae bacterium]HRC68386.1 SCP2 sterol-binding domain-containing protein [Candidatus Competibacter denitrificans]